MGKYAVVIEDHEDWFCVPQIVSGDVALINSEALNYTAPSDVAKLTKLKFTTLPWNWLTL